MTTLAATHASDAPVVLPLGPGDGRTVRLGEVLGRGSAATVYRALLTAPDKFRRYVAVKLFDASGSEEADAVREALARTVRKTACVHHPNVLAPVEFATYQGRAVIVSELVEGAPLAALQEAHPRVGRRMPPDLALFIALEIAEGLCGAREARTPDGVLLNMRHHDLSPSEVLISWHGEVKVTDFGVSAALRTSSGLTSLSKIARRCATMAPEVVSGARGDARSDVFSLGIILRQMLVGPRFPDSISEKDKIALAREGAIPIGLMESPVQEPIASILHRALEIEPGHRYPDASRLAFDLRRACLSMGVGDGRVFLRAAMRDLLGQHLSPGDPTRPEPPPPSRKKTESGEIVSVTTAEMATVTAIDGRRAG
jgi:serine/threonine-protein kinase